MQLCIENIGPIGSAHIDLMGLTVIGGLNDTGKSTIGKVLFAIVQAIRNKENEYAANQQRRVAALISELVSELRNARVANVSPIAFRQVTSVFRNINLYSADEGQEKLRIALADVKERIFEELSRRSSHRSSLEPWEIKRSELHEAEPIVDATLERIRIVLSEKIEAKDMYFASFDQMLENILHNEVNNKRAPDSGMITLSDSGKEILHSTFINDSLDELSIEEDVVFSLFEEATLIESPFVLNYSDSGNSSPTTSDLLAKLNFALNDAVPNNPLELAIAELVSTTIGGKIYYDSDENDFIFSSGASGKEVKISIGNTASGVKTLGIIQMLASAGFLNSTNLLVIDEPEVHLHPAWQIVFAEIIALLVSNNVYCLVSSHSPYFIQAIEVYSKQYNLEASTNFYISKKESGNCYFQSVTHNLDPLYKLLADPMKEISFLKARYKAQRNG